MTVIETVDIASGPDAAHRYDVYTPSSADGSAVVLVHGGVWWQGDKRLVGVLTG